MGACCHATSNRKTRTWMQRVREVFAWVLLSAGLVFMPKCPACLAAYVALWTGLGMSLTMASYLRWGLLFVCVTALLFLLMRRLVRMGVINYLRKETEQ